MEIDVVGFPVDGKDCISQKELFIPSELTFEVSSKAEITELILFFESRLKNRTSGGYEHNAPPNNIATIHVSILDEKKQNK